MLSTPLKLVVVFIVGLGLQSADADTRTASDPMAELRAVFVRAYDAALNGTDVTDTDSEALHAYPLYPYLQAARIAHALGEADGEWNAVDDRAARFLRAHQNEPVARPVSEAWLSSLARRAQWRTFIDEYRPGAATATLHCLYLKARIEVDDIEGLAPAIIEQWLSPTRLPPECEPVFQWLRAEGPLTEDLIEQRVRLLLDNGEAAFARVIADRLPAERAAPLLQWSDLILNPAGSIDALIAAPDRPVEADALLAGWTRLAISHPDAALSRYRVLIGARNLSPHEISALTRALALGLAWDRRSEALRLFARIDADDLDDYVLAWLARAAMWAGDWQGVADAIARMSPEQGQQSAWRYWAARASEQLRDRAGARQMYASVLPDDNYYAALAAARLNRNMTPHSEPLTVDAAQIAGISSNEPFVRAHELFAADMRTEAMREWRYGVDGLRAEQRRQSIAMAAGWGWYDVAVATATQQGVFNDYRLLFPEPYAKQVEAARKLTLLDTPLIYALLRQESLFHAHAVSSAGAMGLAQLLPETARRVARRWNQPAPSPGELLDPDVSIKLGAAQLRTQVDAFDGQIPVGLAAYNAGGNNVEHWLPDREIDSDVWIENIPYNETRAYVRRVLWQSLVFKWLDTGRPQNTRSWLAPIRPRSQTQ